MRSPEIAEIVKRDGRYAYEAYEFVFEALNHTQKMLDRLPGPGESAGVHHHVTGREIMDGAVDLARREFGFLARTVFDQWGIHRTDDFGELVFALVEASLLTKTETDSRADFHDLLDLPRTLSEDFVIDCKSVRNVERGSR